MYLHTLITLMIYLYHKCILTPFFYVKQQTDQLTEKLARGEILNQAAQSHCLHFPEAQKRRGMCVISNPV